MIFALETGLSSDPPMNWRLSALDRFALVSNSDAHSPAKIGREANVFDTDFSYAGLIDALRTRDPAKFLHTVEFFPEEGKYHYDGHRKCGVLFSPKESPDAQRYLPEVRQEADDRRHSPRRGAGRPREEDGRPAGIPYQNLIPLNEIIAEATGKTPDCQSVWDIYFRFIREFGDEHTVLTEVPIADLARVSAGKDRPGRGPHAKGQGPYRARPRRRIRRDQPLRERAAKEEKNSGQLTLFCPRTNSSALLSFRIFVGGAGQKRAVRRRSEHGFSTEGESEAERPEQIVSLSEQICVPSSTTPTSLSLTTPRRKTYIRNIKEDRRWKSNEDQRPGGRPDLQDADRRPRGPPHGSDPAHLDRRFRGQRHRPHHRKHPHAPADDPRPHQELPREARIAMEKIVVNDVRNNTFYALIHCRYEGTGPSSIPGLPTPSPWPSA